MVFACKDIQKSYGIDTILEKVSFNIEDREKVAIVGVNGAGKTTVFKIITGEISADNGDMFIRKDASMGYLAQNFIIDKDITIYDEILSVFNNIMDMENKLRDMENKMADISEAELPKFMEQYSRLSHDFEQLDGYSYKSRIKGVLNGLGFTEEEYNKPLNTLSGGQKTRVHLGKLLLTQPDLLLLDEPTNHLDIESLVWLEDFLRSYPKAVLIISHDRYFMDRIVTKVIEIENRKSTIYEGNYSYYAEQKEINRQIQLKQYINQQKEIKHQEEVIRTLRSFNREKSIKRAESREKALEKMEKVERPESLPDKMRLTLTPRITSGNDVIHAENLSKSFPDKTLFSSVNFDVRRSEKVAIIGPNGVGKSTLFKMLLGKVEYDSGEIKLGTNVNIGYYDQEQQTLDETKTIFKEISDTYPNMTNGEIRNVLAAFVFTGDDIFKTIGSLSGGEKGRIALAKIMLSEANLLMLDEPTNHLDMFSKEILENAINSYEGTVIYISHDRYFINRTAERILDLSPYGVTEYLGNYDYYLEKKSEKEREAIEAAIANPSIPSPIIESNTKIDWKKQKEEQAKERKIQNKIKKIEEEIEKTENKINELSELLFDEKISCDAGKAKDIFDEKTALEEKLEKLFEEWEELQ